MALTPSQMIELGTPAPDFSLPDTDGKTISLGDVKGEKGTLLGFICNHCPFVKHVADELAKLGAEYQAKGIGVVMISSNDVSTHPGDSPEKMKEEKAARGYTFPYLYDESQEVAKAYSAACTPDFYVFDAEGKLAYRGQMDDSRPDKGTPDGADLRAAMDALIAGQSPPAEQKPSIGCNIKWKSGSAPSYA